MSHSANSTTELHPTSFARLVHERIPAGASIAVLGAVQNDDALWFASQGHLVTAVWSVDTTREETEKLGPDAVHTIVMDSYDFDFPEKLRVQNEQLSRHAAELGFTVRTVEFDWYGERFRLPL